MASTLKLSLLLLTAIAATTNCFHLPELETSASDKEYGAAPHVKTLFGLGLGYQKVVWYKPVLVLQKPKHNFHEQKKGRRVVINGYGPRPNYYYDNPSTSHHPNVNYGSVSAGDGKDHDQHQQYGISAPNHYDHQQDYTDDANAGTYEQEDETHSEHEISDSTWKNDGIQQNEYTVEPDAKHIPMEHRQIVKKYPHGRRQQQVSYVNQGDPRRRLLQRPRPRPRPANPSVNGGRTVTFVGKVKKLRRPVKDNNKLTSIAEHGDQGKMLEDYNRLVQSHNDENTDDDDEDEGGHHEDEADHQRDDEEEADSNSNPEEVYVQKQKWDQTPWKGVRVEDNVLKSHHPSSISDILNVKGTVKPKA
ncbi:hypothetical protein Fcan01_06655 [Folsomia candida]|uniref:Uncharacterized protein n=1 Tax=Folsomia candida TaxID=158441 RepID=A0A226EL76_FOLCA|nr:hypothetical protein Fcan01_06655 [Folsomia candida]